MLDAMPGVNLSELKSVEKKIFHSIAEYTRINPRKREKQPRRVCLKRLIELFM